MVPSIGGTSHFDDPGCLISGNWHPQELVRLMKEWLLLIALVDQDLHPNYAAGSVYATEALCEAAGEVQGQGPARGRLEDHLHLHRRPHGLASADQAAF